MANTVLLATHNGVFHADEVLATVIMSHWANAQGRDIKVTRTRDMSKLVPETIIYDVGGGAFDHHQPSGNGCRENGVPYASAGLILGEFGIGAIRDILPDTDVDTRKIIMAKLDDEMVSGIDGIDNGVPLDPAYRVMTISNIISQMNPDWDDETTSDEAFWNAVELMDGIFVTKVRSIGSRLKAEELVEEAFIAMEDHIMLLPCFCPWDKTLLNLDTGAECLFVIYPNSFSPDYCVRTVPVEMGSPKFRKGLPEAWRGLRGDELSEKSGIPGGVFVHPNGFIGGNKTIEGAIAMAKRAMEM